MMNIRQPKLPSQSTQPSVLPEGMWKTLLNHSFTLVDNIASRGISNPFWTFGGGTVLMLRYGHRLSKDIDIFVPDPSTWASFHPD